MTLHAIDQYIVCWVLLPFIRLSSFLVIISSKSKKSRNRKLFTKATTYGRKNCLFIFRHKIIFSCSIRPLFCLYSLPPVPKRKSFYCTNLHILLVINYILLLLFIFQHFTVFLIILLCIFSESQKNSGMLK